jgi:CRP/FNR family cyclic AMP-dependent transcriptional regulator
VTWLDQSDSLGDPPRPAVSAQNLRQVDVFQSLSPEQLATVAQSCNWHRYDAGCTIPYQDILGFCVVASGRVLLTTYQQSGRQAAFDTVRAGECFGAVSQLVGSDTGETVEAIALQASLIAELDSAHFMSMLEQQPAFALDVLRDQARCMRRMGRRIVEFSTLTVRGRLHVTLLRMAQYAGVQGNRVRLEPAPRHQLLASYIGSKREQITRELSLLQRQGLVVREGKALVLCDVERLRQALEKSRLKS